MKILTISVDFDGTIIYENYPALGDPVPGAKEAMNLTENEGKWIIVRMTTKCPKCGREYTSAGAYVKLELDAGSVECDCGFQGEINPP